MRNILTTLAVVLVTLIQPAVNIPESSPVQAQEPEPPNPKPVVQATKPIPELVVQAPVVPPAPPAPVAPAPVAPVVQAPTSEQEAKMFIYMKESGNNPYAVNKSSGACGLAQSLPCSKMNCALGDYACQDAWATQYMLNRYGSWANAQAFWLAHHWW